MNEATISLKTNMRKLWADHAIWTRQDAVSAAFGDVITEIDTVADTISQGIMKHFPDKF
jgi:hypothetical protein